MPTYQIPSDSHAVGDAGHTTDHNHIADVLTLYGNLGIINPVLAPYGADPTGTNDSWAALDGACQAAAAFSPGGTVLVPPGTYKLSRPLVIPGGVGSPVGKNTGSGVTLMGASPANADLGSPAYDVTGTVFFPANSAGWSNPSSLNAPGLLYYDGSTSTIYRPQVVNCWVDFTLAATPPAGLHGFTSYGSVFHASLLNFGVRGATGDGIHIANYGGLGNNRADGWSIRDIMVQGWGVGTGSGGTNYGFYSYLADTQIFNVHVQQSGSQGDGGCFFVPWAANCVWIGCRADQGAWGWVFDAPPGLVLATPGTCSRLIGCGSENVTNNALWVQNSTGLARNEVNCTGCTFDYPGAGGATTGANAAAVLVSGWNIVTLSNCHVNAPQGHPNIGLRTQTQSATIPQMIDIDGGFWNVGGTPMIDDAANVGSTAGNILRYRFYGKANGAITTSSNLTSFVSSTWP